VEDRAQLIERHRSPAFGRVLLGTKDEFRGAVLKSAHKSLLLLITESLSSKRSNYTQVQQNASLKLKVNSDVVWLNISMNNPEIFQEPCGTRHLRYEKADLFTRNVP
jgi:hypothetical protein